MSVSAPRRPFAKVSEVLWIENRMAGSGPVGMPFSTGWRIACVRRRDTATCSLFEELKDWWSTIRFGQLRRIRSNELRVGSTDPGGFDSHSSRSISFQNCVLTSGTTQPACVPSESSKKSNAVMRISSTGGFLYRSRAVDLARNVLSGRTSGSVCCPLISMFQEEFHALRVSSRGP